MVSVKIKKLISDVKVPSYAHSTDAGMDFYSAEDVILKPNERRTLRTGISMAIPNGYVGLIWDKSGIASKNGIKTMAGVIDSGYRGEVMVVLHNLSENNFEISKNMKIAQMLIQPVHQPSLVEVDNLDDTSRGSGAFGSTGK